MEYFLRKCVICNRKFVIRINGLIRRKVVRNKIEFYYYDVMMN